MRNARNSEETLRKEAIERTDLSHLKDTSRLISVDSVPGTVYQVESTGAVVSLNSSVGLIHFYCSQLPSDRCFTSHSKTAFVFAFSLLWKFFCSIAFCYLGIQYFVPSLLWRSMRSQGVQQSIHASFNFPVMHHLRSLRVLYAVQCALHSRHDFIYMHACY